MANGVPEPARAFDAYEIIGIITPGTVVALLLAIKWPAFRQLIGDKGLSIGDLGLLLLVAFVLGHLIQAAGNLIEPLVWPVAGLPSNRLRSLKQTLVTPAQRDMLQAKVDVMEGVQRDIGQLDRSAWRSITTRIAGRIKAAGRSQQLDASNRAYGMCRGLSAALAVSLLWYAVLGPGDHDGIVILTLALVAAVWRMRRAGIHYARALTLEFIDLP